MDGDGRKFRDEPLRSRHGLAMAPAHAIPWGMSIDHRLAVYGTLAPGRENHHQMAGMAGTWRPGSVRGHLVPEGWGAALGYPALMLDPAGPLVPVQLFESADLPAHWPRLDDFEGPGYRRTPVTVALDDGPIEAWIYAAADPMP
jgi:gamma-glutamylcyclotransferase (GGCT)/AIG2-like uncharacterized protein YtfP